MRVIPLRTSTIFETESRHCGGASDPGQESAPTHEKGFLHRKTRQRSGSTTPPARNRLQKYGNGNNIVRPDKQRSISKNNYDSNTRAFVDVYGRRLSAPAQFLTHTTTTTTQERPLSSQTTLHRLRTAPQASPRLEASQVGTALITIAADPPAQADLQPLPQAPRPTEDNVDNRLVPIPTRAPLPRYHSRQCVPAREDSTVQCTSTNTSRTSQSPADRHLIDSPPPSRSSAALMALKFLTSHTGSSEKSTSAKLFDIRLDNDYIVFRGNEDEAASAQLAGSLVLCLTDPLHVSHVTLTMIGVLHMSWMVSSTSSMTGRRIQAKEKVFYEKKWDFWTAGKSKNDVLHPDNYEWPFDCILDGSLAESVEGMKEAWIIYRLKAEIGRKRGKDIVIRKPLRLVRTLDPSALELAHAMSVDNIWPNKVEYSISIPSKAVVFGSFLQVDFKLIPLLKGLKIGTISTQVKEEQELVVDPEWNVSALHGGITKIDRVVAWDNYALESEQELQIIDEAAEGYQFTRYVELPKTLNKCLQDCNVKGIKVRHKVKFNVQLLNPDGHTSELRANLPISLYISPNLPINENNDLVDQTPQASRAAVMNDMNHSAPPLYGEHTLDKLYSEVDPSGYLTPGAPLSGAATPYLQSRNGSSENLSLNAIANGSGTSTPNSFVSPAALQSRLQNLHISGISQARQDNVGVQVHPASNDASRRGSENVNDDYFASHTSSGSHSHTRASPNGANHSPADIGQGSLSMPIHIDGHISGTQTPLVDHMEDLAKVPSYQTAVKTPLPRQSPYGSSSSLPTYGAAITIPQPPPPMEPPSAHLRTLRGFGTSLESNQVNTVLSGTPPTASNRSVGTLQDEERRLRMMQMRGRG